MTTLLISGVIAFGLGLVMFAAVGVLLFLQPQRKTQGSDTPAAEPSPAEHLPDPSLAPPDPNAAPVSLDGGPPSLPPAPAPEEDSLAHINTGVMNIRDFENFEELIAAAETLTKGQKEE